MQAPWLAEGQWQSLANEVEEQLNSLQEMQRAVDALQDRTRLGKGTEQLENDLRNARAEANAASLHLAQEQERNRQLTEQAAAYQNAFHEAEQRQVSLQKKQQETQLALEHSQELLASGVKRGDQQPTDFLLALNGGTSSGQSPRPAAGAKQQACVPQWTVQLDSLYQAALR